MIMTRLWLPVTALLGCVWLGLTALPVSAVELELVESDSLINFVGSKPDGKHQGGFNKFTVDANANFDNPEESSLAITIDAASLWSDNEKLTNHLKNPDFFDVRKYPKITFESTEITPGDDDDEERKSTIAGNWTMLGKTVEVEIPITSKVTDEAVKVQADFTIDRTKWGMTYGQGKINNDVKVHVEFLLRR
jgi:polyisoprenoid-binding protein YceI